jgi:hypothetical protein
MPDEVNGPGADAPDNRTVVDTAAPDGSKGGVDWVAGLETDNRTTVEAKQWASANDAIKAYRELESHASKALSVPGKDATAEDWNKLYEKLGRPESPDKYELKVDRTNLPAEMPYDETFAVEFRNWAHEAGLNPRQVQALHDKWVGKFAEGFTKSAQTLVSEQEAAHRELTAKWGDAQSEAYKKQVELMSRAARNLDLTDALKAGNLITADGGIRNAKLAMALAKVGAELFAEDSFATGNGGVLSNPWSKDSFNLTEQGKLVRSDPNKAKALIRAAGKDPAHFGL